MEQQLLKMLEMQDAMNAKVHPDWRNQGYEWYRAIWVECAELMDHYGWKWWKKQTPDMEQVILELVDIWHFGLSDCLQSGESIESVVGNLQSALSSSSANADFKAALETFTGEVLNKRQFDAEGFCQLMYAAELSFDQLFAQYMGKNVLNFFRQDHGYKEGSYIKVWQGKEDNEHLVEVLAELDSASATFQSDVYEALASRYPNA